MVQKKLLPEEIQALRVNAEKERAAHAEVMTNLRAVTMSPKLQMTTLMSSYNRQRDDEIMALLEAHAEKEKRYDLAPEVMLFIYEHGDELSEAKNFMLANNHLVYELEKRVFDDKLPPFFTDEKDIVTYPVFSNSGEVYMVKETLKACLKADKISDELVFLTDYTEKHKLSDAAEVALTDFLFVTNGRDSVLDTLRSFVLGYLVHYQDIAADALLRIIQADDHELIQYYVAHSTKLISDEKVLDALFDRADAEEVTTYYNRWAKED